MKTITRKRHDTDIIIVGAGCVGLSLALALPTHYRIAIIDSKSAPPNFDPSRDIDPRVFAINGASETFFRQLGVWDRMLMQRHCGYETMHVWDARGDGDIRFDCRDDCQSHLGTILELAIIEDALLTAVKQACHIELFYNTPLCHLQPYDDGLIVLSDSIAFHSHCVLGADGAHSWTREAAGIGCTQMPYPHTAVVTTVQTQYPHARCARQVFLPSGPLAFLPLHDPHLCSIVWSTSHIHAAQLCEMSDDAFCHALLQVFPTLGEISSPRARHAFPLIARHAKHYAHGNIALVGDAAHTIHPLAGQGMNLGLADAKALAQVLSDHPASFAKAFEHYERQRRGSNALMQDTMTSFVHLFGADHPTIVRLRTVGLKAFNALPLCKAFFTEKAAGG